MCDSAQQAYKHRIMETSDAHLGWTIRAAFFRPCECQQCWQCYASDVLVAYVRGDYELDVTLFRDGTWNQWDQIRFILEHGRFNLDKHSQK